MFEKAYEGWLQQHIQGRKGENLRRLKEGLSHANKEFLRLVWWPVFGNFEFLHPEYEVMDIRAGKRYLDFAYVRPPIRICYEIDGFSTHVANVDRWQFIDSGLRQNRLVLDRWGVMRFSYDAVKERVSDCQSMVRESVEQWFGWGVNRDLDLTPIEKVIIRLAIAQDGLVTLADVQEKLKYSSKWSSKLLKDLVKKGLLEPVQGIQRITVYKLVREDILHLL